MKHAAQKLTCLQPFELQRGVSPGQVLRLTWGLPFLLTQYPILRAVFLTRVSSHEGTYLRRLIGA